MDFPIVPSRLSRRRKYQSSSLQVPLKLEKIQDSIRATRDSKRRQSCSPNLSHPHSQLPNIPIIPSVRPMLRSKSQPYHSTNRAHLSHHPRQISPLSDKSPFSDKSPLYHLLRKKNLQGNPKSPDKSPNCPPEEKHPKNPKHKHPHKLPHPDILYYIDPLATPPIKSHIEPGEPGEDLHLSHPHRLLINLCHIVRAQENRIKCLEEQLQRFRTTKQKYGTVCPPSKQKRWKY